MDHYFVRLIDPDTNQTIMERQTQANNPQHACILTFGAITPDLRVLHYGNNPKSDSAKLVTARKNHDPWINPNKPPGETA